MGKNVSSKKNYKKENVHLFGSSRILISQSIKYVESL